MSYRADFNRNASVVGGPHALLILLNAQKQAQTAAKRNNFSTRAIVEAIQSGANDQVAPAYFEGIQDLFEPLRVRMERNSADALTPTNVEQDGLDAARDLCR